MKEITASELRTRLTNGETIILIDVREPHEHEEFNLGGDNHPLGDIMKWSEELAFPIDSEIVLYCRSGNRSAMAQSFLVSKGFNGVHNLTGGIIAWKKELANNG
jgi:rhodanese-related sulfurtransferase